MATPEDIDAERVKVCGGTTRGPPNAKDIKKAVEVLGLERGKKGQLLTLERARMIVRCLSSFMSGCAFTQHPERGSAAYSYARPPMGKTDCIGETVSLLGHGVSTVRAAYAAIAKGHEAVLEWCGRDEGRDAQLVPEKQA
jgi:hypothetical protein